MSKRLPSIKARQVIRVLRKLGFIPIRQRGSHIFFKHLDGRYTLVPYHSNEDIGRGLLRQILKEIRVSPDEFLKLLK